MREFALARGSPTPRWGYSARKQPACAVLALGGVVRGEKAGDLPVQRPTRYILTVNLKTAKALGLTVPATLLARADEAIE